MKKKKINKFRIFMYIVYVLAFVNSLIQGVMSRDGTYILLCIWILNTLTMFYIGNANSDIADKKIEWRDLLINILFKELKRRDGDENI